MRSLRSKLKKSSPSKVETPRTNIKVVRVRFQANAGCRRRFVRLESSEFTWFQPGFGLKFNSTIADVMNSNLSDDSYLDLMESTEGLSPDEEVRFYDRYNSFIYSFIQECFQRTGILGEVTFLIDGTGLVMGVKRKKQPLKI